MTIAELTPTKKREITSGTKEWADYNINCIKGCSNDCKYCYAKIMAKRFGRCEEGSWKDMIVNKNAVERDYRKYNGRVMFPSTHDITDDEKVKKACFTVICKLLESGNEMLLTTKPRLSVTKQIIELFGLYMEQLQFRFTITSMNNHLLSFWEPHAPSYEERFASLEYAYAKGCRTSVSIEPFLDYVPQTLIRSLSPYVTESIWLGPMNYMPSNSIPESHKHYYQDIRRNYSLGHLQEIHEDLRDNSIIRFKDSMVNRLGMANCI